MERTEVISTDDLNLIRQGILLGALRKRVYVELSELSEMTGIPVDTISDIEQGELVDNHEVLVKVIPIVLEKLNPIRVAMERVDSHQIFSEILDRCEFTFHPGMYDDPNCDLGVDEIVFYYQSLLNGKMR